MCDIIFLIFSTIAPFIALGISMMVVGDDENV